MACKNAKNAIPYQKTSCIIVGAERSTAQVELKNEPKIVGFHTLGCKVNQSETEAMTALFLQRGYQLGEFCA